MARCSSLNSAPHHLRALRDLSVRGVGIQLNGLTILPTESSLSFDEFRTTHPCRLIWRQGHFIGVEFQPGIAEHFNVVHASWRLLPYSRALARVLDERLNIGHGIRVAGKEAILRRIEGARIYNDVMVPCGCVGGRIGHLTWPLPSQCKTVGAARMDTGNMIDPCPVLALSLRAILRVGHTLPKADQRLRAMRADPRRP